ncbi:hypothetical protein B0H14DRAFT_3449357 [Mycena olivaceomarginata]|nr:hypothetical protein B0H14DRAFT_3449357 [Mycena olivaceomarginata]
MVTGWLKSDATSSIDLTGARTMQTHLVLMCFTLLLLETHVAHAAGPRAHCLLPFPTPFHFFTSRFGPIVLHRGKHWSNSSSLHLSPLCSPVTFLRGIRQPIALPLVWGGALRYAQTPCSPDFVFGAGPRVQSPSPAQSRRRSERVWVLFVDQTLPVHLALSRPSGRAVEPEGLFPHTRILY